MKFLVSAISIAILSGCTSFPAAVLPNVVDGVPKEVSPLNSKQIYLSGVKTRIEKTSVGQMKIGSACMNEKEFKWANHDSWDDIFRDTMISEFAKYKFNIPQNTLEQKNQADAEILIGARMVDMAANICSASNGIKGDVVIKIEWTIFDKVSDKASIIETYGKGHVPDLVADGAKKLYKEASADAARNLMALEDFYSLVSK